MEFFKDVSFVVNNNAAEVETAATGKYYPVRDTCMKKDDPQEKCVLTEALYYAQFISKENADKINLTISSENSTVVNSSYAASKEKYYDAHDLDCSKDTYAYFRRCVCSSCLVPSAPPSAEARVVNGILPDNSVLSFDI